MNASTSNRDASPLAPVVVFAYMRPDHLKRTVESLLRNPEAARTDVTVFCDAPKRPEHGAAVDKVRTYVNSVGGFASVTRIFRSANMGLARSIVEGVTETLRRHDRVIVLEDDLELSRHFLRYMNDGLECYRDDAQVASIHGYWYPTDAQLPETFFLKGADCWGWATWARAWSHYEADGRTLLAQIEARGLAREIDYGGNYPHMKILKGQIAGKNDSWAIRWHLSCYLRGMLTLYPSRSLVQNSGHDASGTHCSDNDTFAGVLTQHPVHVERSDIVDCEPARRTLVEFFRSRQQTMLQKAWQQITRRLGATT
jgi:hypothetical protein